MRQFQRQNLDTKAVAPSYVCHTLLHCGSFNLITDLHLSYKSARAFKNAYMNSGHLEERDMEIVTNNV